jgi:diguanylate cyclase (GGDEF)-like protein
VVLAALAMIVVQLLFAHVLDQVALIASVTTGVTLVLRQWLALHDADKLAMRLSEDEFNLRTLAYTDSLTGVANRRELLRVLHEEATGGAPCVLLAIDLDGFKNVNDLRGHDVGDGVLAEVARRLRTNLRDGDVAARMGGDEFAVLMWADLPAATVAADRLLATLAQPYETAAGSVFVSASIGVAGCHSATDVPQLLRNADLALQFAKQRGKDRVELYDVAYDEWLRRRTGIEHELRGAIARDELNLAYQPIVELASMRIVGVEALLRWEHPTFGSVPPDEFIPIAEDAGMIGQLDQWVLHRACRQVGRWRSDGHDVWLSVNISVRELHLVDYVAQVTDVLRAHRLPPDRLVLEITEHAVAVDLDELVAQLEALRAQGVRIALDDFGAGYSSLGRLRWLPVDILKIDRSLVGDPHGTPSRRVAPLVDVVVTLGRRLDLMVIAEGVAEAADLAVVEQSGAALVQGELFGRAMPAERVEAMLAGSMAYDDGSGFHQPAAPRPRVHDVGQLDSGREMRQS